MNVPKTTDYLVKVEQRNQDLQKKSSKDVYKKKKTLGNTFD